MTTMRDEALAYWTHSQRASRPLTAEAAAEIRDDLDVMALYTEWPRLRERAALGARRVMRRTCAA